MENKFWWHFMICFHLPLLKIHPECCNHISRPSNKIWACNDVMSRSVNMNFKGEPYFSKINPSIKIFLSFTLGKL